MVPEDMDEQGWFQLDLGDGVIKDVQAPEGVVPGDVTAYLLRYLQISYLPYLATTTPSDDRWI